MRLSVPGDFAKAVADVLGWKLWQVNDPFEFDEDNAGFFWARLKPKKFLDTADFRAVCALVRDLGGEDYLKGAKAWKVPGPYAKKAKAPAPEQPADTTRAPTSNPTSIPTPVFTPSAAPMDARSIPVTEKEEQAEWYDLQYSVAKLGRLVPVLKDGYGNIIDGFHRKEFDPKWEQEFSLTLENIKDPVQLLLARMAVNVCRRKVLAEEKTKWLRELVKLTGWAPKQIAENIGWSLRTVYLYLPKEMKEAEPEELARARLARTSEKTEAPAKSPYFVQCERCRVGTTEPVHVKGKFSCPACAEKVAEKPHGTDSEPAYKKPRNKIHEEELEEEPEEPSRPIVPLPEGKDFAEVTCPVCNVTFRLAHHGHRDHRVEYYREDEED